MQMFNFFKPQHQPHNFPPPLPESSSLLKKLQELLLKKLPYSINMVQNIISKLCVDVGDITDLKEVSDCSYKNIGTIVLVLLRDDINLLQGDIDLLLEKINTEKLLLVYTKLIYIYSLYINDTENDKIIKKYKEFNLIYNTQLSNQTALFTTTHIIVLNYITKTIKELSKNGDLDNQIAKLVSIIFLLHREDFINSSENLINSINSLYIQISDNTIVEFSEKLYKIWLLYSNKEHENIIKIAYNEINLHYDALSSQKILVSTMCMIYSWQQTYIIGNISNIFNEKKTPLEKTTYLIEELTQLVCILLNNNITSPQITNIRILLEETANPTYNDCPIYTYNVFNIYIKLVSIKILYTNFEHNKKTIKNQYTEIDSVLYSNIPSVSALNDTINILFSILNNIKKIVFMLLHYTFNKKIENIYNLFKKIIQEKNCITTINEINENIDILNKENIDDTIPLQNVNQTLKVLNEVLKKNRKVTFAEAEKTNI
jgi:hypothetical protein